MRNTSRPAAIEHAEIYNNPGPKPHEPENVKVTMRVVTEVVNDRVVFGQVIDSAGSGKVAETGGWIARLIVPKIVAVERHHLAQVHLWRL